MLSPETNKLFKMTKKGFQHYMQIEKDKQYVELALQLILYELNLKRIETSPDYKTSYKEHTGWVSLHDLEKISVNARSLLQELYLNGEVVTNDRTNTEEIEVV